MEIMAQPVMMSTHRIPSMKVEDETEKRALNAKFDLLMLGFMKAIDDKEMISLYRMINSPDKENLVVAEEAIKQLFKHVEGR